MPTQRSLLSDLIRRSNKDKANLEIAGSKSGEALISVHFNEASDGQGVLGGPRVRECSELRWRARKFPARCHSEQRSVHRRPWLCSLSPSRCLCLWLVPWTVDGCILQQAVQRGVAALLRSWCNATETWLPQLWSPASCPPPKEI